jgi:PAS domain S-box-containing protein
MAALAVLVNAVVGIFNIDRTVLRDRAVKARIAAQTELTEVLSDMKDGETGQRGYIITGELDYLKPFQDAEVSVPVRQQKLRLILADQPAQLTRLDGLDRTIADKFLEMKRTIAVRDTEDLAAAAEAVSQDIGKKYMDQVRSEIAALSAEQIRLLEVDQEKAAEQRWTALLTLVIGAVMAVGIILTAAAIVRLETARRLSSFAALQRAKNDAESALNQLDAFFRNAPCGIAYYDADLRYIHINEAFAKLNRLPAEELIGKSIEEVPPNFPLKLQEEYLEVSKSLQPAVSRRLAIADEIWEISVFPVKTTKVERLGMGVIGIDVTAAAEAEARILESEARFRTMAEAMPQIVWMTRPDGYAEYFNLRWYEFTGLTPDQSLGPAWVMLLHPDDRARSVERWQISVDNAIPYEIEYRFRKADGKYRWFLARANPIRNEKGQVVRWLGTCTDIDDSKQQAEKLEELIDTRTAALRRSNEELEKFAYIASHDLQEPLRKIQAFGDRLNTRYKADLGEQGQDYIARMLDSAGRMRRLIDDLLSFSRVTTKIQPLAPVNLNAIVRDVLSDLEIRVAQSGGRVEVGPLPTLPADSVQMRQLFQNLVGNALKFQRPGVPPVVTVKAEPLREFSPDPPSNGTNSTPHRTGFRITVADNGIGFEAQYADRIFELFQRLHGRKQYEGTGLGLAICKKIAARHGGAISAKGYPGEGSTFTIDLPTSQEVETYHATPTPAGDHSRRR